MLLNSRDKDMVERLKKRQRWLESRIAAHPVSDLTYDRAEAAALKWAIQQLEWCTCFSENCALHYRKEYHDQEEK